MEKEVKILMIASASSALKYKQANPSTGIEEAIKHVILTIKEGRDLKIAGIAAANHALKYQQKHPKATEKEIMQDLSNNIDKILNSMKNQENPSIEKLFK